MMRVNFTASSNLPGTWWKPEASRFTQAGVKMIPSRQNRPTTIIERRCHQIRQQRGFLAALMRQRLREDGDEGGGERALGEKIARQIGNAEAQQKRVVDEARAEQARHDDFAQQSRDAGHGHRHRDHPGRPDHALGRRRIVNLGRQMNRLSLTVAAQSVRLAHLFEKVRDGHNAGVVIAESILFVRRV